MTVGSGRDFLEGDIRKGQSQGLLKPADPVPVEAVAVTQADAKTAEGQAVRVATGPWESTWRPIVASEKATNLQHTLIV